MSGIIAVAAGGNHSLAVRGDGTVVAWGGNTSGELGGGTFGASSAPVQALGITGVIAVAAGDADSLAVDRSGAAWAWGYNNWGEPGDGTFTTRNKPVAVVGIDHVSAIAAGAGHSHAVGYAGQVWSWRDGLYGEMGNGTSGVITAGAPPRYNPTPILTLSTGATQPSDCSSIGKSIGIAADLQYRGGPVQTSSKTYLIFWLPAGYSVASGYQDAIRRFFTDVGSATTPDLYGILTQYYSIDSTTHTKTNVVHSSALGCFWTDTRPYGDTHDLAPPSYSATVLGQPINNICVGDGEIAFEVDRAASLNNWTVDPQSTFLVFTGQGEMVCGPGALPPVVGLGCSGNKGTLCGYHSSDPTGTMIYAAVAYPTAACQVGRSSNVDIDSAVSISSHELFERVTDPSSTSRGWCGPKGYHQVVVGNNVIANACWDHDEVADKCEGHFPTQINPDGSDLAYGSDTFYVQEEWSNRASVSTDTNGALTRCSMS